jgi:hypothetical protein
MLQRRERRKHAKYRCQALDNTADQVADKLAGLGDLGTMKMFECGPF